MRFFKYLLIASAVTLFINCEGKLDLTNPNKQTDETFWKNESDFEKALTSCYTPLKNWNGGYYGTRGIMTQISRADDIEFRNDIAGIYSMHRFTNDPNNDIAHNLFYQFYNAIYRANMIIQELNDKNFSKEFIDKIKGEALFIRGMYYFQLAKEFKDVPLRLTASQNPETFQLEKSPQKKVYEQAVSDFLIAKDLLPVENDKGKPTSGAALAYLGKTYIYMENWEKAKETLELLTKSPYHYKLVDEYSWNFDEEHEFNSESIFEIIYDAAGGSDQWDNGETANSAQSTTIAVEYASGSVGGWFEANVTQKMMDIFLKEKAANGNYDHRVLTSVAWNYPGCMYYMKPINEVLTKDELNKYWIIKYQNSYKRDKEVETMPSFINIRAFRYADVLLLLAEAELNLENTPKAIDYIDMIRTRGGNLKKYSGPDDPTSVKNELIHQRAIEFFKEGERFYDLRRWGILEQELKAQDPQRFAAFKDRNLYLPIPSKEIQTNLKCKQHEGW